MTTPLLTAIRDLIQKDVGKRGLARDPKANLLSETSTDFAEACRSIAGTSQPHLGIVTGFFIPHATPPAGETDGPLGALYLARTLVPLGIQVTIITDAFLVPALQAGLERARLLETARVVELPAFPVGLTHLIALERVGPSHTATSIRKQLGSTAEDASQYEQEVPSESWGRCHTMGGRDITSQMQPVESYFLNASIPTIGIGDGGNEIGMGKIPWRIIRANIPNGGKVACRVRTDHLIVAGVSNWGSYALSAGIAHLRGRSLPDDAFDPKFESELLDVMVQAGPLVDGMSGKCSLTVDGLTFDKYVEPLVAIGGLLRS